MKGLIYLLVITIPTTDKILTITPTMTIVLDIVKINSKTQECEWCKICCALHWNMNEGMFASQIFLVRGSHRLQSFQVKFICTK